MKKTLQLCLLSFALILTMTVGFSQAPTGSISGVVHDESGAVMVNATIRVTNKATGFTRQLLTWDDGTFGAPSLNSGIYTVRTEAKGFRSMEQEVTVEVGGTTRVDVSMQVGQPNEVVTVEASTAQIEYESHSVDGVVNRQYIDALPLNGRSFLQLASMEPGVTVSPAGIGQYNRQFDVNILGSGSEVVRITVDGATVNDSVTGGTQQNFSQDVVQEFQVSIANFDLSTGITGSGAVNVVTRSGGNDFHGSAFFYFRDHNMAAYPYLQRDPHTPDPFFARRQPGFWLGGPIKKDKLFFFASYEHNNQRGVFSALPSTPEFVGLGTNASTPYNGNLVGVRLDYRINDKHSAFLRYSHDGNNSYAPANGGSFPSNYDVNTNWADSGVFSVVSTLKPTLVNEFRYSFTFWSNKNDPPTSSVCPSPCLGLAGPDITIVGVDNFEIGNATNAPQSRVLRRHIFADNLTWQKGAHRIKYGGEWEYQQGTGTYAYAEPAAVVLWSPYYVRLVNQAFSSAGLPASLLLPLPSSFNTLNDILQLPVAGFATGVGDINQPPTFQKGNADHNNRFHLYLQDSWRIRPNFTLNYGLAWSYESDLLNHDLTKPQFLAPVFGANGLGKEAHSPKNFSPMLGFAWSPGHDKKTVIRGGGGIYYDTFNIEVRLLERAALGPRGTGRALIYDQTFFPFLSSLAQTQFVPPITSLSDRPNAFTGAMFEQLLPTLRGQIAQLLGVNPNNTDLSVRNVDVFKTAPGLDLFAHGFRLPYVEHGTFGIQRQLTKDMVLSADFVWQHHVHERIRNTDVNHYSSAAGPVIPKCVGAQALDPAAECSTGPITADVSGANSTYKGLLVKLDKRMSRRYLFTASYALSSRVGYNGLIDDSNWRASVGPQQGRHLFNLAAVTDLPWGFKFSLISSYASKGPFQPSISGIDLNGNGIDGIPIPGGGYNQFNISKDKNDLVKLVSAFNQTYAGKKTPRGQDIPTLTLPSHYDFGKSFNSQDVRVTKDFKLFTERYKLTVFGEVFNILNIANLGGYSGDLTNSNFGQPTSRVGQVFGSGGPRAFQVGGRFTF
jgi:hypothetical protein